MAARRPPLPWLKPAVLVGACSPVAVMAVQAARGGLGANPVSEVLNRFGLLAYVFLLASLACTPMKDLLGWTWPVRLRRLLGVTAFFYALAHLLTYAVVDQGLALGVLLEDIAKRPFIAVGFLAFCCLLPLAITSTDAMVRRMGYVRWKRLHRLAYLAGLLAAVHFLWRVKQDLTEPLVYGAVLAVLLFARLAGAVRKRVPAH